MAAYLAVGVWHHWLVRRDVALRRRDAGRVVRRALDFVVAHAAAVRRDRLVAGVATTATGAVNRDALLAGSSSIYQSLRAGVALAELLDEPQPEWELAGGRLGHALREHRDLFLDKSTFSMDWYYPVLGGAVRGEAGREPDRQRAGTTSWCPASASAASTPTRGSPAPRPASWCWRSTRSATATRALRLFADMQHLRDDDGGYWTGYVYPDERALAGRAHDVHRGRGDPRRRRAGRATHARRLRDHARRRRWSPRLPPSSALECGCDRQPTRLAGRA